MELWTCQSVSQPADLRGLIKAPKILRMIKVS